MSTIYIHLLSDDEYKEMPFFEFEKLKGEAVTIHVDKNTVYSSNPERSRQLDAQTPHVSARRFLLDLFPGLSIEVASELAVELTRNKETLVIRR